MSRRRARTTLLLTYGLVLLSACEIFRAIRLNLSTATESTNPAVIDQTYLATIRSSDQTQQSRYANDEKIDIGVLSSKPESFFRKIQQAIDDDDPSSRCRRYGFSYNATRRRRIFYGTLMASESWEVFELVAAEMHGLLEGMVLVESNRTQNYSQRVLKRLRHASNFQRLFGTNSVLIREYVEENRTIRLLDREHAQRAEILRGWKELGMTVEDVGYVADADETFTRDFLRAIQSCSEIPLLDYKQSNCRPLHSGIAAASQIFEMSPDCITTADRVWKHPDLIIGHCVNGIGDEIKNPTAKRETTLFRTHLRASLDSNDSPPLFDAADFRTIGGRTVELVSDLHKYERFTGYHFHNFVTDMTTLRHKYLTYAHPDRAAMRKPLEDIHEDLALVIECVQNISHHPKALYERVVGGYSALKPWFRPIYFADDKYRQRRHELVSRLLAQDERDLPLTINNTSVDEAPDDDYAAAINAGLAHIFGDQDADDDANDNGDNPTATVRP